MTDIVSPEQRKINMQHIKGKNTGPEVYLRKQLFHRGFRFRIHVKDIPGHPDIWLKKYNTVILVHGCFWHRHEGCKYAYTPKTREKFWLDKFEHNIERDIRVKRELERRNIKHIIVWECTIRKMKKSEEVNQDVLDAIECFLYSTDQVGFEI